MNLIWLPNALADLNEIYDYYMIFSKKTAAGIYNNILDKAALLPTHPRIAPREPLLEDAEEEIRSLVVADGKYKLTYSVDDKEIVIIGVFSCRQNPGMLRVKTLQRM
jgi:plasmid stabilization system protein ParE